MTELGAKILERLRELGLGDVDQRSALGIARTWVEKPDPVKRSLISGYEKRDDLAVALVGIMEEAAVAPEECVAAIKEVRKVLNRPFQEAAAVGGKHITLLKPKEGGN